MSIKMIVDNIGKRDDCGRVITLEQVASAVIDSGWHYSWHWEREDDLVTLKGWQAALDDGQQILDGLEAHAKELRDVLPYIRGEIAAHDEPTEWWINLYSDDGYAYKTEADAKAHAGSDRTVHVREVIE